MRFFMRLMMLTLSNTLLCLGCAGQVAAQPAPAPAPADAKRAPATTNHPILDALHARGRGLESLAADVKMTESDPDTGDASARTGKVWLQIKPDGAARFRAMFDKKEANNRIIEDRVEYVLEGQNLIDRTYRTKTQVTRQVLKPGEKINLLKLGEGPFPLPIGQSKEEVHRAFDVTKPAGKQDDPPGTVHITLVPQPGSQFERKFKSIDVWVDTNDHMPKRIETLDVNGVSLRTTDLSNVRINAPLGDADLSMPKIDNTWTLLDEAFQDGSPKPEPRARSK
jgi:outer membrane lipoprotein-sorting protein